MALSEAEELELLELEEAEAAAGGQSAPQPPKTGLERAVDVSEKVTGTLGKVVEPLTSRIGKALQGIHSASQAAAEREAELAGQKGVLPISAMVPAIPAMAIEALGIPERAGEYIAEKGGEMGFPNAAAALGTGVAMAPDIAAGAAGIAKRGLISEGLQGAARKVTAPARFARDLVTRPNVAEATQAGKEALMKISEKGGEKLALARETKDIAKKGLIKAEEKAGLHFESTPEFEEMLRDPKRMASFSQRIGRLAKRTPEELAQTVDSKTLQTFRKVAQEGEKVSGLSDIAKSQMREGKDVFTRALGRSEKGVGEALNTFREADKVTGEIPSQIKSQLDKQKFRNSKDVLDAKSFERKRKVIRGLAKSAGYALGLKWLLH